MARVTRRAVRYEVHLPLAEVNRQTVTDGILVNISSLGVKLDLPFAVAPRLTVEFAFLPPGGKTPMRLSGQVVWMRPSLEKTGRFWHGVQFYQPRWEIEALARGWQQQA